MNHCQWEGQIGHWMNAILPFMEQQADFDELNFAQRWQFKIYDAVTVAIPRDPNLRIARKAYSFFFCPSDPYRGFTTDWEATNSRVRIVHYYAVGGVAELTSAFKHVDGTVCPNTNDCRHCNAHDGVFYNDSQTKISDITDGLASTALIAETWGRTVQFPADDTGNTGGESRGMNLHAYAYFQYTPNSSHNRPWRSNSCHDGGVHIAFCDGTVRFVTDTVSAKVFAALGSINGGEIVNVENLD